MRRFFCLSTVFIVFLVLVNYGAQAATPEISIIDQICFKYADLIFFPEVQEARQKFLAAKKVKWPPDKDQRSPEQRQEDFQRSNELFREIWQDNHHTEAAVDAAFEMADTFRWQLKPREPLEALKIIKEFIEVYPQHRRIAEMYMHFQACHRYELKSDASDDIAFDAMAGFLERYPDHPERYKAYVAQGELYSRFAVTKQDKGLYQKANECYERALETLPALDPSRLEVLNKKAGVTYFDLKDREKAAPVFLEVITAQYNPLLKAMHTYVVLCYEEKALDFVQAEGMLQWIFQAPDILQDQNEYKRFQTHKAETLYALGYLNYREERFEAAHACFSKVLDRFLDWIYPDLIAETCYFLAYLETTSDQGNEESVRKWYAKAIELAPKSRYCWPQDTSEIPLLLKILDEGGLADLKAHFERKRRQEQEN